MFGAVAPAADHATAETVQVFLDTLRAAFPDQTIHLVLDNATIHHAKALQPYRTDHPELDLRFLPPNSPNLNNTKRLWQWLHARVILNTYFPNLDAIRQAVARFLSYLAIVPDDIQSRLNRLPA